MIFYMGPVLVNDMQTTTTKVAILGFCAKKLRNAVKPIKKHFPRYGSKYLESSQKKITENVHFFSVPRDAQCSETNAEPIFRLLRLRRLCLRPANQIQKLWYRKNLNIILHSFLNITYLFFQLSFQWFNSLFQQKTIFFRQLLVIFWSFFFYEDSSI